MANEILVPLRKLDEGMPAPDWYRPTDRGLEQRIRERMAELKSRK